jgi:hypothetical protein
MTIDDFFAGQEESRLIFEALHSELQAVGNPDIRVTKNQVAFRRRRAFA